MSILCHIWKIVPDLYEAIQKMSSHSGDNNNVTFIPIPNCSVQSPENEVRITEPQWYIWVSKVKIFIISKNISFELKPNTFEYLRSCFHGKNTLNLITLVFETFLNSQGLCKTQGLCKKSLTYIT